MQPCFDMLFKLSKKKYIYFDNIFPIIISQNNILLAYRNIKSKKGSKTPGINRHTIYHLKRKTVKQLITYVRRRLIKYYPSPVKCILIPKRNGDQRRLAIPTIEERLLEQCIKQGYAYIVEIDIKKCFESIRHESVIMSLKKIGITDRRVLAIINKMQKARLSGVGIPDKGIGTGSILSPLLANVVLNELDWWVPADYQESEKKKMYIWCVMLTILHWYAKAMKRRDKYILM